MFSALRMPGLSHNMRSRKNWAKKETSNRLQEAWSAKAKGVWPRFVQTHASCQLSFRTLAVSA